MNSNYIIRPETEKDYETVENLTRDSFWNVYTPGCTEHYVLNNSEQILILFQSLALFLSWMEK